MQPPVPLIKLAVEQFTYDFMNVKKPHLKENHFGRFVINSDLQMESRVNDPSNQPNHTDLGCCN